MCSSIQQVGSNCGELLMPPRTPADPWPPLPLEIDDEFIFVGRVEPQPKDTVSKLVGFNLNIKIYLSTEAISRMELAYGIEEIYDWATQKRVLYECLQKCKHALDGAPQELLLLEGSVPKPFANSQYFPPTVEYTGLRTNGKKISQWQSVHPEAQREHQYEIQKANIYASQLSTRSYIVEKYCNLQDMHEEMSRNDAEPRMSSPASNHDGLYINILEERNSIYKELLVVLSSISQVNMEPNGGSFVCARFLFVSKG